MTAGAYGATMSSTYNTRLLIPEVLVKGDAYAVVRPRPSYDELIGMDRLPEWLALEPTRHPGRDGEHESEIIESRDLDSRTDPG